MGLHFEQGYYNTVPHFREFGGKKILVSRDLKMGLRLSTLPSWKMRCSIAKAWCVSLIVV